MESNTINQNNSKRIFSWVLMVITIVSFIFCLTGCFDVGVGSDLDNFQVTNTKMTYEYNSYTDDYDVKITGKAKNISEKDFSSVSIEFTVYDAEGNSIGICDDYISGLSAGDTWSFEATLIWCEIEPASFKLFDISCF